MRSGKREREGAAPCWANVHFDEELNRPETEQGDYVVGYAADILFGKGRRLAAAGDFVETRMAPGAGAVRHRDRGTLDWCRPCRCRHVYGVCRAGGRERLERSQLSRVAGFSSACSFVGFGVFVIIPNTKSAVESRGQLPVSIVVIKAEACVVDPLPPQMLLMLLMVKLVARALVLGQQNTTLHRGSLGGGADWPATS